jgi:hypothetical protein
VQNLWQDGAALVVVVGAAIYLAQRAWCMRSSSRGSGCTSGCAGCSPAGDLSSASNAKGAISEIIPIQRLRKKVRTADEVGAEQVEVRELLG